MERRDVTVGMVLRGKKETPQVGLTAIIAAYSKLLAVGLIPIVLKVRMVQVQKREVG